MTDKEWGELMADEHRLTMPEVGLLEIRRDGRCIFAGYAHSVEFAEGADRSVALHATIATGQETHMPQVVGK